MRSKASKRRLTVASLVMTCSAVPVRLAPSVQEHRNDLGRRGWIPLEIHPLVRSTASKPRSTDVGKHKSPTNRAAEAMVRATSTRSGVVAPPDARRKHRAAAMASADPCDNRSDTTS